MTYEQSLKNIETLINLVVPLSDHQVFFNFSNNTEFKIILLKNSESESISDLVRDKFRSKIPVAKICISPLDHEILYYEDYVFRYKYNLTTQEMIMNDQKKGFKSQSSAELAIEMSKLLLKLKNM